MSSNYPGTQPDAPISDKQVSYVYGLARRLDPQNAEPRGDQEAREYFEPENEDGRIQGVRDLTRLQASQLIDFLKAQVDA